MRYCSWSLFINQTGHEWTAALTAGVVLWRQVFQMWTADSCCSGKIRHVVPWLHLNARVCIVLKILLIKSGTYVESWGLLGLTVKAGSSGCCWDHEHITVTLVQMGWGKKFGAILMLRALTCCSASLAHSRSSVAGSLQLCEFWAAETFTVLYELRVFSSKCDASVTTNICNERT